MKICLIGNSGFKKHLKDGQTTKFRLYKKKIEDEGCFVYLVDLENFFHNPLLIFYKIKKGVKSCDRIILISGHRACKLLIPYINKINKKYHKPFVLPVIGSGVLHFSVDHLNDEQMNSFYINKDYFLAKKNKRIQLSLSKIDHILLETKLSKEIYQSFYGLNNCSVLNNFRDNVKEVLINQNKHQLKLVYVSRVMAIKGIFDLLEAISFIEYDYILDIYGPKHFSGDEENKFNSLLNNKVSYKGEINNEEVIEVLNKYDLFVFPSRCAYEGTPGVVSEALIAGIPILTSNFPQAPYLLNNNKDSIFYEMYNQQDLRTKLEWCILHKEEIRSMKNNVLNSGRKFTYEYNRFSFLKYVCGIESE